MSESVQEPDAPNATPAPAEEETTADPDAPAEEETTETTEEDENGSPSEDT